MLSIQNHKAFSLFIILMNTSSRERGKKMWLSIYDNTNNNNNNDNNNIYYNNNNDNDNDNIYF